MVNLDAEQKRTILHLTLVNFVVGLLNNLRIEARQRVLHTHKTHKTLRTIGEIIEAHDKVENKPSKFITWLKQNKTKIAEHAPDIAERIDDLEAENIEEENFLAELMKLFEADGDEVVAERIKKVSDQVVERLRLLEEEGMAKSILRLLPLIDGRELEYLERESERPADIKQNLDAYIAHLEEDLEGEKGISDKPLIEKLRKIRDSYPENIDEELSYLQQVINHIKSSLSGRNAQNIGWWISELKSVIERLKQFEDEKLNSALESSNALKRLINHEEELDYFRSLLRAVEQGEKDPSWEQFEEVYNNAKREADRVAKEFGDIERGKRLISIKKGQREYIEGWKRELGNIGRELVAERPKIVQEGVAVFLRILNFRIHTLREEKVQMEKDIKEALQDRIEFIKKIRGKTIKKLKGIIWKRLKALKKLPERQIKAFIRRLKLKREVTTLRMWPKKQKYFGKDNRMASDISATLSFNETQDFSERQKPIVESALSVLERKEEWQNYMQKALSRVYGRNGVVGPGHDALMTAIPTLLDVEESELILDSRIQEESKNHISKMKAEKEKREGLMKRIVDHLSEFLAFESTHLIKSNLGQNRRYVVSLFNKYKKWINSGIGNMDSIEIPRVINNLLGSLKDETAFLQKNESREIKFKVR